MINDPKVAVVILNWNGKLHLQQFLPSVYNSNYANLEIIIGDNGSTDDSISFVKEYYPNIKLIYNDKNYGFAAGYNKILQQVEADYFVLLNSDVEVSLNWIEPVIRLMESDPLIAAAQPKLRSYYDRSKFEYAGAAGGMLDVYGYPFCRGRLFDELETDHGQYNDQAEVFWASGAALFIKKHCWDEVKGFDADFFAHMEEIDLCWRLKNLGYKIMYCPESTVYHVGGGTLNNESPFKTYLNFRNNLAMLKKNLSFSRAFRIIFIRLWLDLLSLFHFLFKGKFGKALAISRAHRHFFLHLFKRSHLQTGVLKFNKAGLFNGSVVWAYFVKKKKKYSDLDL